MKIAQTELFYKCICDVLINDKSPSVSEEFLEKMGKEEINKINDQLSHLLREIKDKDNLDIVYEKKERAKDRELKSEIITLEGADSENVTYFFRINDAAFATVFPILGVMMSLITLNFYSASFQLVDIGRKLYQNLVTLHHRNDSAALDVVRTVAALRIKRPNIISLLSAEFPTTSEIIEHLSHYESAQIHNALKRVTDLGLIKCQYWGDQISDYSHPNNQWGETI